MTIGRRCHSFLGWAPYILLVAVAAAFSLQSFGCACTPIFNPDSELTMRGNILDADTREGLVGVSVNAQLITGGAETTRGDLKASPTGEDGAVGVLLLAKGQGCGLPDLPAPDRLRVILTIDGCEQTFLIDINEDTVVDLDFPDRVIELKEPILVSDCG